MIRRYAPPLLLAVLAAGCTAPGVRTPSLAPRAAEAIDPRIPIPAGEVLGPVTPSLAAELERLRATAAGTIGPFDALAAEARASADVAGPAQSESWIAAQQTLSALVAVRAPATRALGDIDAIAANALEGRGGLLPGDRHAVEDAAAEVAAIDRRQAATIAAIAAVLAR